MRLYDIIYTRLFVERLYSTNYLVVRRLKTRTLVVRAIPQEYLILTLPLNASHRYLILSQRHRPSPLNVK